MYLFVYYSMYNRMHVSYIIYIYDYIFRITILLKVMLSNNQFVKIVLFIKNMKSLSQRFMKMNCKLCQKTWHKTEKLFFLLSAFEILNFFCFCCFAKMQKWQFVKIAMIANLNIPSAKVCSTKKKIKRDFSCVMHLSNIV